MTSPVPNSVAFHSEDRPGGWRWLQPAFICLFFGALLFVAGCGSSQTGSSAVQLPPASGPVFAEVANDSQPKVRIRRDATAAELTVPQKFAVHVGDELTNRSDVVVRLACVEHDATLSVKPGAELHCRPGGVVMKIGTSQFEMRRVNGTFVVTVPGATLSVRGTRFEVHVASDSTSCTRLFEGALAVKTAGGADLALTAGQQVRIPADASAPIVEPIGDLKGAFEELPPDEREKLIR